MVNINCLHFLYYCFLSLALNEGGRIFLSPSSPLSSLLCSLVSYWETLSALLSKLKDYGFDQLVSQRNWHHLFIKKLGFRGTWLPGRNVRSWLYDGRVGEVANRVSSGSFRGGHWRYLPIRNHDNRYFADWIRLCPGLSKNSEDGNSCPKPHKAARLDWSCGKSGQHWDWDYQSQYGFYQGVAHGFTKENWLYWRPKWTERVACKIGMRLLAPKTKQSYLFLAPPHSGLGKAVAGIYPGRATQWDALASSPTLQTLQTLPLPRPLASVRFEPPACQAGLTSAGLVAAGPDGCLLGRIHFPCGYVVCLWCMCFCVAEVFFLFSHCSPQGA